MYNVVPYRQKSDKKREIDMKKEGNSTAAACNRCDTVER
jgi:hypothetical protein